ncbi:MAG: SufD family Fe-S cluster assembly protein, partial [Candidatus Bathyarchaeia archaeon]
MYSSKDRAMRAINKPSEHGPDLDISQYAREAKDWNPCMLSSLPKDILERVASVGVIADDMERAATYFQIDHSVVFEVVREIFENKIEVMSIKEALMRYDWLKEYWWKAIEVDKDKYTALAELALDQGYFIRVFEDQKVVLPLQACMFISTDNLNQNVHNIIIAEAGSEA